MNQSRILALDLGKRRIGLALSDELGISAQGLDTLERTNIREDLARLSQLVVERGVSLILIGNPLHMSGREGRQAEHAREFGERDIKWSACPAHAWSMTINEQARMALLASRVRPTCAASCAFARNSPCRFSAVRV